MAQILIAEDDADIRRIVIHALVEAGHDVSAVKDGESVVERLTWAPPELLILDIMMPGQDGYSVLEEMRSQEVAKETQVMVLTAKNREKDVERSYRLGAAFHMTKPFDPDELVGVVRRILDMSATEAAAEREQEADKAHLLSQIETVFGK
ncbi:MAG: response regulator [Actinomycetota bacterium]